MVVHAKITLSKDVEEPDKADDWFAEVKKLLQGHTDCRMSAASSNREDTVTIEKET